MHAAAFTLAIADRRPHLRFNCLPIAEASRNRGQGAQRGYTGGTLGDRSLYTWRASAVRERRWLADAGG
jgi:hypothetical protein